MRVAAEYEAEERARRAAEEMKREVEREAAACRRRASPPPRSPVASGGGLSPTTLGSTGRSASFRPDQSYGYGDDDFEDDFEDDDEVEAGGEAARSQRRGRNVVREEYSDVIVDDVFTTSPLNLNLSRGSHGGGDEIEEDVRGVRGGSKVCFYLPLHFK